jgi:hypothetical protein
MAAGNERLKKHIEQRKRHFVSRWLTSFAITATVVVAAVIMPPKQPLASIDRVGTLEDTLYYTVTVRDFEAVLLDDSLKVTVSNQMENYEFSLDYGTQSGFVPGLKMDTVYDFKIVGNTGYGTETLAKTRFKTQALAGGAILSADLMTVEPFDYFLSYDILIKIIDPENTFESVALKYAVLFHDEGSEMIDLDTLNYQFIPINQSQEVITIDDIPNYNAKVVIVLEAMQLGKAVILDYLMIQTPLSIEGSVYPRDASPSSIDFSVYVDNSLIEGIQYYLDIYQENRFIKRIMVPSTEAISHYDGTSVQVKQLKKDTLYNIELIAQYTDPFSGALVVKKVNETLARTTPEYSVNIEITDQGDYYRVTILIDDPFNFIHHFRYTIYDIDGEYPAYLIEHEIFMTLDSLNRKTADFQIQKPIGFGYLIEINADKILLDNITYYQTVLDELSQPS